MFRTGVSTKRSINPPAAAPAILRRPPRSPPPGRARWRLKPRECPAHRARSSRASTRPSGPTASPCRSAGGARREGRGRRRGRKAGCRGSSSVSRSRGRHGNRSGSTSQANGTSAKASGTTSETSETTQVASATGNFRNRKAIPFHSAGERSRAPRRERRRSETGLVTRSGTSAPSRWIASCRSNPAAPQAAQKGDEQDRQADPEDG